MGKSILCEKWGQIIEKWKNGGNMMGETWGQIFIIDITKYEGKRRKKARKKGDGCLYVYIVSQESPSFWVIPEKDCIIKGT